MLSLILDIMVLMSTHRLGEDEAVYRSVLPRLFQVLEKTEEGKVKENCLTVILRACRGASRTVAVGKIRLSWKEDR